jgi:Tol biopolymer transport system component
VGTTPLGQLQHLDARTRNWTPHLGGISADMVEYSRDGQDVVYATFPEGELWVRHSDGSSSVRLTTEPMQAEIGRWSPDGRVIAFTGKSAPDQPRRIYLVDAAGGTVRPASPKEYGQQGDFTWAPDGKTIVFDAFYAGDPHLMLLNLATGEATDFPASDGLHSPRWSPDGSALAALAAPFRRGQRVAKVRHLMLYSFSDRKWRELPNVPQPAAWPSWSRDGKSIWHLNYEGGAIMRYHLREQRNEEILPLKREEFAGSPGTWFNLTANDEPMILRRRDIQQIYALEWKPR